MRRDDEIRDKVAISVYPFWKRFHRSGEKRCGEGIARLESRLAYRGDCGVRIHSVRTFQFGEIETLIECPLADLGNGGGYRDRHDSRYTGKCVVVYGDDSISLVFLFITESRRDHDAFSVEFPVGGVCYCGQCRRIDHPDRTF